MYETVNYAICVNCNYSNTTVCFNIKNIWDNNRRRKSGWNSRGTQRRIQKAWFGATSEVHQERGHRHKSSGTVGPVPHDLEWGTLMQIVPPGFQKYRSEFTKTRHFKWKIPFFSGEVTMFLLRIFFGKPAAICINVPRDLCSCQQHCDAVVQ